MEWPGWPTVAAVIVMAACEQSLEIQPDLATVEWTTYSSAELGVSFEHPKQWAVLRQGNSIALQGARTTAARVTVTDRDEARRRGLWGRTAVVRTETINGREWDMYRYRHYDGPSYVPTIAFVAEHGSLELGVEFRTEQDEPGPVDRKLLESVRVK